MKLLTKVAAFLIVFGIIACIAATFRVEKVAITFLALTTILFGVSVRLWVEEREVET